MSGSALSTRSIFSRPLTSKSRPKTAATSTGYGYLNNDIVCAITESRGISPSIGLAFVNLTTCESALCQFVDTQTFARTCHKIKVFEPSEIIFATTAAESKLISIITENLTVQDCGIETSAIDRKYWSESAGLGHIERLAFPADLEALKLSLNGQYYAVCCFSAALKYVEVARGQTFTPHSLRISFQSSEGAMMIDLSTIANLELVQNLQNSKSKDCLFGILNETKTRMGTRLLKNNVLQPSTDVEKIEHRYAAVEELNTREDMLLAIRESLQSVIDTDRILAALVIVPTRFDTQFMEQSVNNVLMLKSFVELIEPIWQHLSVASSLELQKIRELCNSANYREVQELIEYALNPDVGYSKSPTDLRNQRVYAIKSGTNGFLDVARQSYSEFTNDAKELVDQLSEQHEISMEMKFDTARQFYIKIKAMDLDDGQPLPGVLINVFRKKKFIECQTLDLIKINQKIKDAHHEVISTSDHSVQELIRAVRSKIQPLFRISEALAMLDLLATFAYLATTQNYTRPELSDVFAIRQGRHPIKEKIQTTKYIANDTYASQSQRFQIITGCNMSGKSTYIRSVALLTIMAQIGSFVPADYACFPPVHQLFARVATDDCIDANVSTFAAEMREMAFILRHISPESLVIVDELGRGTSTSDGLAIATAISEALIESKSYVWFVTHFRDLPRILSARVGVVSMHMSVDIDSDFSRMRMRYKISEGQEEQKLYGLALAQLVNLPHQVMETAVSVSKALHARNAAKQSNAKAMAFAKKRKLVLQVQEALTQARDSSLEDASLRGKLIRLQQEFTARMTAIDSELAVAVADEQALHEEQVEDIRMTESVVVDDEVEEPVLQQQLMYEMSDVSSEFGSSVKVSTDPGEGSSRQGLEHSGYAKSDAITIDDDGRSITTSEND